MNKLQPALERLLIEINTISKIQRGERLCTRTEFLNVESESIKSSIIRTVCSEDRTRGMGKINNIVISTMEYANLILESRYLDIYNMQKPNPNETSIFLYEERISWLKKIKDYLHLSQFGITNYSIGYIMDAEIETKCTRLVENIKMFCVDLETTLDNFQKDKVVFISKRGLGGFIKDRID